MKKKCLLFLLLLLLLSIITQIKPQTVDYNVLQLQSDYTNTLLIVDNPLKGKQGIGLGFYSFWFRMTCSEHNNGYSTRLVELTPSLQNSVRVNLDLFRNSTGCFLIFIKGYQALSEIAINDNWYNAMVGFGSTNTTWTYKVNNFVTSLSLGQAYNHSDQIAISTYNYMLPGKFVRMSEISFWFVNHMTTNMQDFFDRYYGISQEYGTSQDTSFLQDFYPTLNDGNSTASWKSQIGGKFATSSRSINLKWVNETTQAKVLCPPGFRNNHNPTTSKSNCIQCTNPCFECAQQSSTRCLSCDNGFNWYDYSCLAKQCPAGQYLNYTTRKCENCISPCSTCLNSTACTFCPSTHNLIDDGSQKCLLATSGCPVGTYKDKDGLRVCRKCPIGCTSCDSQGTCTACTTNKILSNGTCVNNYCTDGTYFDTITQQCLLCDTGCSACSPIQCFQCLEGYYYNGIKCVVASQCPAATYGDDKSRSCMKCQPDCLTCKTNNYTCTSCDSDTFLLDSKCITKCPLVGYFHNSTVRECQPCQIGCELCINNASDCVSCKQGFLSNGRTCSDKCPNQYYSTASGFCYPCDPACKVCTGSQNTQCSACSVDNYLMGTTCDQLCPALYFAEIATLTCQSCKYYCESCTAKDTCNKCMTGFVPTTDKINCTGEYVLRVDQDQRLSLPINNDQLPSSLDPNEMTVEIWLKADNLLNDQTQIIIGMSPYKIRKLPSVGRLQLNYQGILMYCENTDIQLSNGQWHHFAFTLSENTLSLKCYINGQSYSTGTMASVLIAKNVTRPTELTLGGTTIPKGNENNFDGYLREFRYWKIARSEFQIQYFRSVDAVIYSSDMFAYWKLNEVNNGTETKLYDYSSPGTNKVDPTSQPLAGSVQNIMEMRERLIIICPQGKYAYYSEKIGYQQCFPCHSNCKNCKGPTINDCVECNAPLKLVEQKFTCELIQDCPQGAYMDPINGLCYPCNEFCISCSGTPNNCPTCKSTAFRQFQGSGCVESCPIGMYGKIANQLCYFNPIVQYISPSDNSIFEHGDFIELNARFKLLNNEAQEHLNLGWKVIRNPGSVDVSQDIIKTFYNTNITRVHLDNNVLQPNFYYTLTFYVQGKEEYYSNMDSFLTHQIYVGAPPKSGKCQVSPLLGISTVTQFTIKQLAWQDNEPLIRYEFYYSMDGGEIFIPIESSDYKNATLSYIFASTYDKFIDVKIKCKAINAQGFSNTAMTSISLEKKSNADALKDLEKLKTDSLESEIEFLQMAHQINLISKYLGNLDEQDNTIFDPKLNSGSCQDSLCNNNGNCVYLDFQKKYYCNCTEPYGGVNCTFSNTSQITMIKSISELLLLGYNSVPDKVFEFEFLKLTTEYKEMISDSTFGVACSILTYKILRWEYEGESQTDQQLYNYILLMSNLIEYIEWLSIKNNVTKNWGSDTSKLQNSYDNMRAAMEIFYSVKQNTLIQISQLNPVKSFTTRMVSYKQQLMNKDTLQTVAAYESAKRSSRTMIKISPNNFEDANVYVENDFILETIEYAFNPFEIINKQNTATNIFEVSMFNYTTKEKADVYGLENGFEFYFPYLDNSNLTEFMSKYNSLSPFKAAQNLQRQKLLNASQMACSYWNSSAWDTQGCTFMGLDNTHVRCKCNHLTSFSPQFKTPVLSNQQEVVNQSDAYQVATDYDYGDITVGELIVPMDIYMKNLQELLQHKQPQPIDFLFKPGLYVVLIFWLMYLSSLVYYSGRDNMRRYKMTKSQNRDDLAEISDKKIQCQEDVIKDLVIKIQLTKQVSKSSKDDSSGLLSQIKQSHRDIKNSQLKVIHEDSNKQTSVDEFSPNTCRIKQYEEMDPLEQRQYRRRAKKRVFGKVSDVWERANRFYKKSNKGHTDKNDKKMKFFNEALKASLWMGLMSKTSKIAPRHIRLTLMYLYLSCHLLITSYGQMFGYYSQFEQIIGESMFAMLGSTVITLIIPWIICFPVALIFRMPLHLRKQVEGVRSRKVNIAFKEIDKQMGCRYAVGYFISYFFYIVMTLVVIFFNYIYPADYCLSWLFQLVVLYFLDLIVFTFAFAGFQLINSLLASKVKFFYKVWAFFEVIRYYKNLRG